VRISNNIDNSSLNNRLNKWLARFSQWLLKPFTSIKEMIAKSKDLAQTNYELGLNHMRGGNIYDAKLRFKLVIFFRPKHIYAHYRLGHCLLLQGDTTGAEKEFLECLKLDKSFLEAEYMLATISNSYKRPATIPLSIIEEFFDDQAPNYNKEYINHKNYQVPVLLVESIGNYLAGRDNIKNVLDLGCGTGLCALALKEKIKVERIVGIDVSAKMLSEAKKTYFQEHPLYDLLIKEDLNNYLQNGHEKFELIMAGYSLHYSSDITQCLVDCKNLLLPEGVLAFSVEKAETFDFGFSDSAENYCFSENYIRQIASKAGYSQINIKTIEAFQDKLALMCICKI
jgi:predicted TPR repeat methyltransferase